jgi:hypothetical protein
LLFVVCCLWFVVCGFLLYLKHKIQNPRPKTLNPPTNTKTQITKAGYYCRYLFL